MSIKSSKIKLFALFFIILSVVVSAVFVFFRFRILNVSQKSPPPFDCIRQLACPKCNVILISVDSLRADHMGAFGYYRDTTPNFDALAKKGLLFENYFTTSFLTPVSEMSVHTGMYPTANGVTNFDTLLPKTITTLGQIMKKEGYATSAFFTSPEFVGNPALKDSFSRGFDEYQPNTYPPNATPSSFRKLPAFETMQSSMDQLQNRKFFWWLALGSVHWSYGLAPKKYDDPNYGGFFKKFPALGWQPFQNIYQGMVYPENTKLSKEDIQYIRDLYDNGVFEFDNFLGNLYRELDRRGLTKNTIIVIASEHGEDLHEHGYFAHYDIFDTQVHTPLLILSPRVQQGERISTLASAVDVLPTIHQLLGRAPPNQVQGESLIPFVCNDGVKTKDRAVFIERNPLWEESALASAMKELGLSLVKEHHKDIAIRTSDWKYILRTSKSALERISWWGLVSGQKVTIPSEELYDVKNDPQELKNVIDNYPAVASDLRQRLDTWYTKISTSTTTPKYLQQIQKYF